MQKQALSLKLPSQLAQEIEKNRQQHDPLPSKTSHIQYLLTKALKEVEQK